MSTDRELKFFMARVADQAERHQDVVKYIGEIIAMDPKLSADERNLLSVAYKGMTGIRRTGLRTVTAILDDQNVQNNPDRLAKLKELKEKLISELDGLCTEIVNLVDSKLLPAAEDSTTKVFYEKLKADYFRYSVEFKPEDQRAEGSAKAKESYEKAMKLATEQLTKANPQYLGLGLNYTVFLYEIIGEKKNAIALAEKTFKEAVDLLDKLSEDEYSESTLILQLLKDNVALWNDEETPADDKGKIMS